MGSRRNHQLQDRERSCTIPSAFDRLCGVRGDMENHRPSVQLSREAQGVLAEVPQEATRRNGGLTTTSGKRLPIATHRNGALTLYLLPFLLVAFAYGIFGEGFGFQPPWHACVGTLILWDSRQRLGSTGIYLLVCTVHRKVI